MVDYGNAKLIEITMDATQTVYSLKDQKILNARRVKSIIALKDGVTVKGDTVQDPLNAYLVMKDGPSNDIRQTLPLKLITYSGTYPVLAPQPIDLRLYNWEESEVHFGAAPVDGNVLQLLIIYEQEKVKGI